MSYVGIVLIFGGFGTIAVQQWDHIVPLGRLGLFAALFVAFLVSGASLHQGLRPPLARVGAVLWTCSVVMFAASMVEATIDVLALSSETSLLAASTTAALYATILWWRRHTMLQHVTTYAAVLATLGSSFELSPHPLGWGWIGLTIATLGLVWTLHAWAGHLPPRRLGYFLGSLTVFGGLQFASGQWSTAALVVALVAAGLYLVVGVVTHELDLVIISGLALAGFAVQASVRWLGGSMGAPVGTLTFGVLLVAGVVIVGRVKEAESKRAPHPDEEPNDEPAPDTTQPEGPEEQR